MIFIRNKDNIINLERITRIYKEEAVYESMGEPRIRTSHNIVFEGDGQEFRIKCASASDANKKLNGIEEILKKCSLHYCF